MTDIHLNFLAHDRLFEFTEDIKVHKPDALFITGDISEAPKVAEHLDLLDTMVRVPVYFVLGNHDFYHGSIKDVREWATKVTDDGLNGLNWMPAKGVVSLSDEVAVVGVDGWGDGRYGNPRSSQIFLNDWMAIKELRHRDPMSKDTHILRRIPMLNYLGDEEAKMLREPLEAALASDHKKVFVLTHVPPWDTATWYMGANSDPDWQPWFSCRAVGDLIVELAAKHPDTEVTVLCGHTHGEGVTQVSDNVLAITGGAQYNNPKVNRVFEF